MAIGKRIVTQNINGGDNFETDNSKMSTIQLDQDKSSEISELYVAENPKYSFENIILSQETESQIYDFTEFINYRELVFKEWGFDKTHKFSKRMGINLYGPPGTGKTMTAHAIANCLGRKILIVNYADLESKFVGETPKNIKKVFEAAIKYNAIIFFDEADAILSKRVDNMKSATDVSVNQTRSVLLMLLNDYQDYIIFATNFIENIDSAFMRRIGTHIKFSLPDYKARKALWKLYLPEEAPINIDIDYISNKYDNLSGSDISNITLKSAFKVARQEKSVINTSDLEDEIKLVLQSKIDNKGHDVTVTKRKVSEDYVRSQLDKSANHSSNHVAD